MSIWYDRTGQPMSFDQRVEKRLSDPNYMRVAETTLPDGKWVSTVWLGRDPSFGSGPPLIFETMVFPSQHDMSDLDCERYATEQDAIDGHAQMVAKWSQPEPVNK